jgi:hypothetical protein
VSTARDSLAASNEAALELVTSMQEQVLEATKSYVSAITDTSPDKDASLGKLGWTAPDAGEQPDARELIEETFKFQSRLLEANKSFALSLTEAWGAPGQRAAKE